MTPEQIDQIAIECRAYVAKTDTTFMVSFYDEYNFHAFAHRIAEIARKEQRDSIALDKRVADGIYQERIDDNLALCEALRAVYAICGEDKEVAKIVNAALDDYGI